MPTVNFTYALKRFFPSIQSTEVNAQTIAETLELLDKQYPGIKGYIADDQGRLRKHVNIFLDGDLIDDKVHLSDRISENSEIYIMQALSGG